MANGNGRTHDRARTSENYTVCKPVLSLPQSPRSKPGTPRPALLCSVNGNMHRLWQFCRVTHTFFLCSHWWNSIGWHRCRPCIHARIDQNAVPTATLQWTVPTHGARLKRCMSACSTENLKSRFAPYLWQRARVDRESTQQKEKARSRTSSFPIMHKKSLTKLPIQAKWETKEHGCWSAKPSSHILQSSHPWRLQWFCHWTVGSLCKTASNENSQVQDHANSSHAMFQSFHWFGSEDHWKFEQNINFDFKTQTKKTKQR